MASLIPFGVDWPANAAMRERAEREHAKFLCWVKQLPVSEVQRLVLRTLLEKVDITEFIDGRCAGFTYSAEIARRAGIPEGIDSVFQALRTGGYLYMHPAAEVFEDRRPGIVFRIRHPDVVLTAQSAGPLWKEDSRRRRTWTVMRPR